MNPFATSSTVQAHGEVLIEGVPFAPGTEVQIIISPKGPAHERGAPDDTVLPAARVRMKELFQSLKGFRNSPKIPREDLHERGRLC